MTHDDPSNTEFQSLLEAERILDDLPAVVVPLVELDVAAGKFGAVREAEDHLRHDLSNYHALLRHVRSRASSVRTVETASLILRSRVNHEIRRLYPALR